MNVFFMIEEYDYEQDFQYDFRMIICYDTFGPFVPWWYQYYMNILWWAEFFLISLWFPIDSPNLSEYHRESFLLRICSDHNIRIRSLTFEPAIASLKSPVKFQEVYLVSSYKSPSSVTNDENKKELASLLLATSSGCWAMQNLQFYSRNIEYFSCKAPPSKTQ